VPNLPVVKAFPSLLTYLFSWHRGQIYRVAIIRSLSGVKTRESSSLFVTLKALDDLAEVGRRVSLLYLPTLEVRLGAIS
jgi:hypothetical protein